MMKKPLQDAVNEQLNFELSSAYLYLAMSAYCESRNLPGTAHWLRTQFKEEQGHAMKFYTHLADRGVEVVLASMPKPPAKFGSLTKLFEDVLAHEQKVTARIHALLEMARKDKDPALEGELAWFVKEQVEEEKNAGNILSRLKLVGEHGPAIFLLDKALGERQG